MAAPLLRPAAAGSDQPSLAARFEQALQSVLTQAAVSAPIMTDRPDVPADGLMQMPAGWDAWHGCLLAETWRILHFIGHGDFDPDPGPGRSEFGGGP